jgi:trimeric autotransporter adhesin
MGITRVGGSTLAFADATNTFTATYSGTAGNLLVVGCGCGNGSSDPIPTAVKDNLNVNWTIVAGTLSSNIQRSWFAYRANIPAGITSVTATGTANANTYFSFNVTEWSGVDSVTPFDVSVPTIGADPLTASNLTAARIGNLIMGIGVSDDSAASSWAAPSAGWTEEWQEGDTTAHTAAQLIYQIGANTGPFSSVFHYLAATAPDGCLLISFNVAAAVAPNVYSDSSSNRNRPGRGPYSLGHYFRPDYTPYATPPQIYNLTVAESGSAADTLSGLIAAANAVTEAGSAADTTANTIVGGNSVAEAGSAADVLAVNGTWAQALTEAGSAADALSALLVALNTLTEAASASDAVSQGGSVYSLSVSEAGSAADSDSAAVSTADTVSEVSSAADSLATQLSAQNSVTEAGSATDTVNQGGSVYSLTVSEAGAASDALTALLNAVNALVEAGTATASATSAAILSPTVSESGNAADGVSQGGSVYSQSVSESGAASDALAAFFTALNSVIESSNANDAPLVNGAYQALLAEVAHAADAVAALAPFLVGTPGYSIARIRSRRWMVSSCTYSQFDPKAPDESVKLTFDFSPDLEAGVTLAGTPTVTFSVSSGADDDPSALANGAALENEASTAIVVPVTGGISGVVYKIHVQCATTDSETVLSLPGLLTVRS